MKKQIIALFLIAIACQAEARTLGQLSYQYKKSGAQGLMAEVQSLDIANTCGENLSELSYSHIGMKKTLLALKILEELNGALLLANFIFDAEGMAELKKSLLSQVSLLETQALNYFMATNEESEPFFEWIELLKTLAQNMDQKKDFRFEPMPMPLPMPLPECMKPSNLNKCIKIASAFNITSGGAKDANYVKKMIRSGGIPGLGDLVVEGMLSEFNLGIFSESSDYFAINPHTLFDPESKKLYLQLGASSNIDINTFGNKPLNLALLIDYSHSMNEKDSSEKTRLEWVKDIVKIALKQVKPTDILSVIIFNHDAKILRQAENINAGDIELIEKALTELMPKGMTNLYKALDTAFLEVAKNNSEFYENRVILISDAGSNTGRKDSELPALVEKYAKTNIGLTAIGLGANFNYKLVESINKFSGGNSTFVQSGKELLKLFTNLKFLIYPIAYDFKAEFELKDERASFTGAYGIPQLSANREDGKHSLVDGMSFFLAGNGGGATILEFYLGDEEEAEEELLIGNPELGPGLARYFANIKA